MVNLARRWVRHTLDRWGLDDRADDAILIVSELSTNALTHADCSTVLLLLMFAAGTLRIEVRDHDAQKLPVSKNPGPDDVCGRGLVIVEAIADRWGVSITTDGKSVWSELDMSQPRGSRDDGYPREAS
jgi:anti-sigma regulatory factor (Ser/Thr protein kinase)